MKAKVDQVKCDITGRCVKICPEVFQFQVGSKKAKAPDDDIPLRFEEKCREAAEQCPVGAIEILEDECSDCCEC